MCEQSVKFVSHPFPNGHLFLLISMAFQLLPSGISEAGAVYQYLTHIFPSPVEETLPYLGQDD